MSEAGASVSEAGTPTSRILSFNLAFERMTWAEVASRRCSGSLLGPAVKVT